MTRRIIALLFVAAFLAGACGGRDEDEAVPADSP